METTKYKGEDYREAVNQALLNGSSSLEIGVPRPISMDIALRIYRLAERYLRGLELKYDFGTDMKISVRSSKLEKVLEAA